MAFLTDEEREILTIERMIFHVVGPHMPEPQTLDQIAPPEHTDFFVERIRTALRGNLFAFRNRSSTEASLKRNPVRSKRLQRGIKGYRTRFSPPTHR